MSKYKNKSLAEYAELFRALSNPHRLRIFLRLISCCRPGTVAAMQDGQCACVGDVGRDLGIAASTVSHHIKELQRAGLIRMERRGQRMECWVAPETLGDLRDFFSEPFTG